MEPHQRLQKAINDLRKLNPDETQLEILRNLGYTTSNYLSNLLTGNKPITEKFLNKLEDHYQVSKNWILTGEGPEFIEPEVYYNQARTKYHLPPHIRGKEWALFNFIIYELARNRAHDQKRNFDECLAELFGEINLIIK